MQPADSKAATGTVTIHAEIIFLQEKSQLKPERNRKFAKSHQ